MASARGHTEIVKLLIDQKGIDIQPKDKDGWTPMHHASSKCHTDIAKLLLDQKGIDIQPKANNGWTPLHFASAHGNTEILKLLLHQKGINIQPRNNDGNTPLHYASQLGHTEIAKLLLDQKGIDIQPKNNGGSTPLHLASNNGHGEVVKSLLDKEGIDIQPEDNCGKTPEDIARDRGQASIVRLIQRRIEAKEREEQNRADRLHHQQKDEKPSSSSLSLSSPPPTKSSIYATSRSSGSSLVHQNHNTATSNTTNSAIRTPAQPSSINSVANTRERLLEAMKSSESIHELEDPTYVASLELCYLSRGAYGAVYRATDHTGSFNLNSNRGGKLVFALKKVLYHLQDEETMKFVTSTFKNEIKILSKARHPNIIRLYGYYIDKSPKGEHTLLFEYAERGSLASALVGDNRMILTASRRINILFQIGRALCYLHSGAVNGNVLFHRDIKSDNICVTKDFQAKLIDCGLGKLVDDRNSTGSSFTMQSGSAAFGSEGYRCPWYSKGKKQYKPACDVYSFGVVMMEVLTSTLQGGSSSRKEMSDVSDLRAKYLEDEDEEEIVDGDKFLMADADPIVGWEDETLSLLSNLTIECCSEKTKNRPTSGEVVERLARITHIHELGMTNGSTVSSSVGPASVPMCHLCSRFHRTIRCSNGHGLCGECLDVQIERNMNTPSVICPIVGCFCRPYRSDELRQAASPQVYTAYQQRQALQFKMLRAIESLRTSNTDANVAISHDIANLGNAVNAMLTDVDYIRGTVCKLVKGIANQTASISDPCPRMIWLTPVDYNSSGKGDIKTWFRSCFKNKIQIELICQHSFTKLSKPIVLEVTKKWVLKVLPAVKLGIILLKMAAATSGFPLLNALNDEELFVNELISLDSSLEAANDMLDELEQNAQAFDWTYQYQKDSTSKIMKLVGPSYDMLAEKLLKDKRSWWMKELQPVLDKDGHVIYVKTEYAKHY